MRSLLRRLPLWLGLVIIAFGLLVQRPSVAAPDVAGAELSVPSTHPLPGACPDDAEPRVGGSSTAEELAALPLGELLVRLEKPHYVSPPRDDGPTTVGIALLVQEISDIDPATNTFTMEGYLDLVWCDPREAYDPEVAHTRREVFLERDAEKELEYIWWPDFYFVNEVGPRRVENEELILLPNGTIEYREKFGVTLATNFEMRPFPFDSQTLVVEIESFAWTNEELVFEVQDEDEVITLSDDFEIPEWNVLAVKETVETKQEDRDRHNYSELVARVQVERDPGFYVTKIMIPLGIIVGISWAVFWMIGDTLADRMSVSFTGVLTSVAYQFIVSESLPRHIYNTFLDAFVLLSFVMMVLTILENIVVNSLMLSRNERYARIVDMTSRVLFPGTYIGALVLLYVLYLTPLGMVLAGAE